MNKRYPSKETEEKVKLMQVRRLADAIKQLRVPAFEEIKKGLMIFVKVEATKLQVPKLIEFQVDDTTDLTLVKQYINNEALFVKRINSDAFLTLGWRTVNDKQWRLIYKGYTLLFSKSTGGCVVKDGSTVVIDDIFISAFKLHSKVLELIKNEKLNRAVKSS